MVDAIQGPGVAASYCSSFLTVPQKSVRIRAGCLMAGEHWSVNCRLALCALMGMTVLRNYDFATF